MFLVMLLAAARVLMPASVANFPLAAIICCRFTSLASLPTASTMLSAKGILALVCLACTLSILLSTFACAFVLFIFFFSAAMRWTFARFSAITLLDVWTSPWMRPGAGTLRACAWGRWESLAWAVGARTARARHSAATDRMVLRGLSSDSDG